MSPDEHAPLLAGRYRLDKRLGAGGFGEVYLARDEQLLAKLVVVKILKNPDNDPWFVKKFSQEKEALARIRHHGVVEIVGDGVTPDGKPFLVMQYVEGMPLRQAIQPGGMPLARVAGIVRQIGQALSASHQSGVCHRDLKPENIMLQALDGEEHVVLIDFGIAGITDSRFRGATTKIAGSMAYMAPEQFEGKASAASDIYSLGVIAFEMVTGAVPPRGGEAKLGTLRPDMPEPASAAILKALAADPDQRFGSVREFSDTLVPALQSSAVRPRPPIRRIPPWLLVVMGIVITAQITSDGREFKFAITRPGAAALLVATFVPCPPAGPISCAERAVLAHPL